MPWRQAGRLVGLADCQAGTRAGLCQEGGQSCNYARQTRGQAGQAGRQQGHKQTGTQVVAHTQSVAQRSVVVQSLAQQLQLRPQQ